MAPLVLGLDVGGTTSRAVVTTRDLRTVGVGRAAGGNPATMPVARAAGNVRDALRAALSTVDASAVAAAVLGIAGTGGLATGGAVDAFQPVWDAAGLRCPVRTVGDVVVAFAAGTGHQIGTVLIAGTGAVAAQIDGERIVRTADGLGWLLGDHGSAFWIGRAAAAITARHLYGGGLESPLVSMVAEAVLGNEPATGMADAFVVAVHRRSPRDLAALAPVVTRAADAGDPLASRVLQRAAGHLSASVAEVRRPVDRGPIVLAGGVLRAATVRTALRRRLSRRWPGVDILDAGPGEFGAARLAARSLAG